MSILDKMKELLTAGAGLSKLALGGYDNTQVPEAEYQRRVAICKTCPHHKPMLNQCGACSCFLSIKARLEFDPVAQERTGVKTKTDCPKGLWTSLINQ